MSAFMIISMAVGLAMDAFAVAISVGMMLPKITPHHYFRLAFHFGLFQALMPLLGWGIGKSIATYILAWQHWIAFALLFFIGSKMIYESFQDENRRKQKDPTKGIKMVELSVATSIDAFAVGLSLAFLGVEIVMPAIVIGVVTLILTLIGMKTGNRMRGHFKKWAEKIGGIILISIGFKILLEQILR